MALGEFLVLHLTQEVTANQNGTAVRTNVVDILLVADSEGCCSMPHGLFIMGQSVSDHAFGENDRRVSWGK